MSKIVHLLLLLGVAIQLTTAALLVRGVPVHHHSQAHRHKPKSRRAFLRWDRDEQFARYADMERFREDAVRSVHRLAQSFNVRKQFSNVESSTIKDLEGRFKMEEQNIERALRAATSSIDGLISRT